MQKVEPFYIAHRSFTSLMLRYLKGFMSRIILEDSWCITFSYLVNASRFESLAVNGYQYGGEGFYVEVEQLPTRSKPEVKTLGCFGGVWSSAAKLSPICVVDKCVRPSVAMEYPSGQQSP